MRKDKQYLVERVEKLIVLMEELNSRSLKSDIIELKHHLKMLVKYDLGSNDYRYDLEDIQTDIDNTDKSIATVEVLLGRDCCSLEDATE